MTFGPNEMAGTLQLPSSTIDVPIPEHEDQAGKARRVSALTSRTAEPRCKITIHHIQVQVVGTGAYSTTSLWGVQT